MKDLLSVLVYHLANGINLITPIALCEITFSLQNYEKVTLRARIRTDFIMCLHFQVNW